MSVAFERLREVLGGALELAGDERSRYLERACNGDVELRREALRLLAHEADARTFLESGSPGQAFDLAALARATQDAWQPPEVAGYRILERLGEGGFGVVWEALELGPLGRRVALKVLKAGVDSRAVLRRFAAEQQALARLDHPAIARVFDAGTTAQGRPWFALELVVGEPIVRFCRARSLSLNARLALFVQVCAALQHAHQRGLIHRDIKPANVLVADDPGGPRPKVIDFGIAKALQPDGAQASLATAAGELIGTPAYMSPEQAAGRAEDVDTRADVYALGTLLYELLTGEPPFDPQRFRGAGAAAIERIVVGEEPPRPSARLERSDARAARDLRGELDWIVLRALEKDRERRYASVSELSADVLRFQGGEPVLAGPPSALYRLRKLARRHRALSAVGVLALAALVLGLVGTLGQARRAEVARRDAEGRRAEAELQAQSSLAALEILMRTVEAVAPQNAQGREPTVREAVDALASQVRLGFEGPPQVEAHVRAILGRVQLALGRAADAREHLALALALWERELGPEHPETLRALNDCARAAAMAGDVKAAEGLLRRSAEACARVLGPDHLRTFTARNNLALVLQELGRDAEAEPLLREALASQRRLHGERHPFALVPAHNLGALLARGGRIGEAEPLLREALDGRLEALGERHPDTLESMLALGEALLADGQLDEAEVLVVDALERLREVVGPLDPRTATAEAVLRRLEAVR